MELFVVECEYDLSFNIKGNLGVFESEEDAIIFVDEACEDTLQGESYESLKEADLLWPEWINI